MIKTNIYNYSFSLLECRTHAYIESFTGCAYYFVQKGEIGYNGRLTRDQ